MNTFRIVCNVLLAGVLAATITTACGSDNDPTKNAATGGTTSPQKGSGASSGGSTSAEKNTSAGGTEAADSGT